MFSTLLDRLGASPGTSSRPDATRASSSDSIHSVITVDAPNALSSSSTPPTSIGDSASVSSGSMKLEKTLSSPAQKSSGRSSRPRTSVTTYNVKVLSGTAIHAPKKYSKDKGVGDEARRRTVSGDTLVGALASGNSSSASVQKDTQRLVSAGIDALDLQWSIKKLPKSRSQIGLGGSPKNSPKKGKSADDKPLRYLGMKGPRLNKTFSALGKRGRDTLEDGLKKVKRELRNLADTKEYAHIDTEPVIHEVWSKGKLVVHQPPRKKKKFEELAVKKPEPEKALVEKKGDGRRQKVWLNKGLYAGQVPQDWFSNYTEKEKETMPDMTSFKASDFMPLPMWHGQRLLHVGRNFKLPFDVCSPLPPGQPKPDEWRKTSSSKLPLCKIRLLILIIFRPLHWRSCCAMEEVDSF
jgi:histone-lysine N-methyltransferase ASH1L